MRYEPTRPYYGVIYLHSGQVFVGVTQGHGFFYHVQGLLHLVRQRGPTSFTTRLSLQIFHAIRYNSVFIIEPHFLYLFIY